MSRLRSQQNQSHIAVASQVWSTGQVEQLLLYALAVAFAGAFYFYYFFFAFLRRMLVLPGG